MRTLFAAAFLALWLAPGSGAAPVPDFSLMDVNPNSPRRDLAVSPRDYLLQVSGYYFGASH